MGTFTMNGHTWQDDASDFTGTNGYGYIQPHSVTGKPVLLQAFLDVTAEMAGAVAAVAAAVAGAPTVDGVVPGAAGGILVSDGSQWVRATAATITSAGALTALSGTFTGMLNVGGANRAAIDFYGGSARFMSWGPNITTRGAFSIVQMSSDGSFGIDAITIDSAGRIITSDACIVAIGTAVTSGANAGDVVLANTKALRFLNATGTGTGTLLSSNASDQIVVGQTTQGLLLLGSGIGFLGATAVARQVIGGTASDAGTTQTLANNVRTALINLGLCSAA